MIETDSAKPERTEKPSNSHSSLLATRHFKECEKKNAHESKLRKLLVKQSVGPHPDLRQARRLDRRLLVGPLC